MQNLVETLKVLADLLSYTVHELCDLLFTLFVGKIHAEAPKNFEEHLADQKFYVQAFITLVQSDQLFYAIIFSE